MAPLVCSPDLVLLLLVSRAMIFLLCNLQVNYLLCHLLVSVQLIEQITCQFSSHLNRPGTGHLLLMWFGTFLCTCSLPSGAIMFEGGVSTEAKVNCQSKRVALFMR